MEELELPPRHGMAIGAHPKENIKPSILQKVIARAALLKDKNQLFAMGEAGIDFSHNLPMEIQEAQFIKMIRAAKQLQVVLQIHARNGNGKSFLISC